MNVNRFIVDSFHHAGYDYATLGVGGVSFPRGEVVSARTRSLNQGNPITDRETFRRYPWPDPDAVHMASLDRVAEIMPLGMKVVVMPPDGVLECVINLVGFDRLCYLMSDDTSLVGDLFDAVGSRIARFCERVAAHEVVGAILDADDWGFKSHTTLSPEDMRRFVFPWHKRIVEVTHAAGKPAILHSCGNLAAVMDDVIETMRFDAKHSFEDAIRPVEETYEAYGHRIAVLGGIDVDFLCRATPAEIYRRSKAMLIRAADRGGYALGSGNSIPDYVPDENFFAMIRAALDERV